MAAEQEDLSDSDDEGVWMDVPMGISMPDLALDNETAITSCRPPDADRADSVLMRTRYSPVNADSGLHPRPGNPPDLAPFFPGMINLDYTSTVYAPRNGELLREIQDRADLFAEAWPARIEAEMPDVRSVVVFSHAATVIALGRAVSHISLGADRSG